VAQVLHSAHRTLGGRDDRHSSDENGMGHVARRAEAGWTAQRVYDLFLMADPDLQGALVQARDRIVAATAERVGETAAPTVVAALDGLVLDALVRDKHDPDQLRAALARVTGRRSR